MVKKSSRSFLYLERGLEYTENMMIGLFVTCEILFLIMTAVTSSPFTLGTVILDMVNSSVLAATAVPPPLLSALMS